MNLVQDERDLIKHHLSTLLSNQFCDLQAVLTSQPEGQSKLLLLTTRADALCERLEEGVKREEVQRAAKEAERRWRSVVTAAAQAELRTLSDDFDAQSRNTQAWVRERQQRLQAVGGHTPPGDRRHSAQVGGGASGYEVQRDLLTVLH